MECFSIERDGNDFFAIGVDTDYCGSEDHSKCHHTAEEAWDWWYKHPKACPFCGGEATLEESECGEYFSAGCSNSGCSMNPHTDYYQTEEQPWLEWNKRQVVSVEFFREVENELHEKISELKKQAYRSTEYSQSLMDEVCRLQLENEDLETRLAHIAAANELLKSEVKQLKQKAKDVIPNICHMRPTCGI